MVYNGQEFGEDHFVPDSDPDRVGPRPLRWGYGDDAAGGALLRLYRRLIAIRHAHPALRSANFYPDRWEDWQNKPNPGGYGVEADRGVLVFHRWGRMPAGSSGGSSSS